MPRGAEVRLGLEVHDAMATHIGMLLYPGLAQLDLTGPFEVLTDIPGAEVHLVWKTLEPVVAESNMAIVPSLTMSECPPLDVLFVPGGGGQGPILDDDEVLDFLRSQGRHARYVTSVCTGALVLGVAGLLSGYEATTHWAFMDILPLFGARPVRRRVVIDRSRITGSGVTAGIDFSLHLVAELAGADVAKGIQLSIEYDPDPPFRSGHPEVAEPAILAAVRERTNGVVERRTEVVRFALGRSAGRAD